MLQFTSHYLKKHSSSSSRMRVINYNWSATKQRPHPQSVAEISRHSVLSGDIWVSPEGHRSVSVSRHFLLQAPHCPCSVRKRFSRDQCCRGRSKPGCQIVGSHTRWWLMLWDKQTVRQRCVVIDRCDWQLSTERQRHLRHCSQWHLWVLVYVVLSY